MVKINKVYTRTGDDGTTGLVGGVRVRKNSIRVSAYGDIDELNAYLGLIRTVAEKKDRKLTERIAVIQNELFDIGSLLATPSGQGWEGMPKITEQHISRLELWIDEYTESLPELRSFVLPGGTEINAHLHIARTICRRAERSILTLDAAEPLSSEILRYLNRLSDLLFCMAREDARLQKAPEFMWVPGKS